MSTDARRRPRRRRCRRLLERLTPLREPQGQGVAPPTAIEHVRKGLSLGAAATAQQVHVRRPLHEETNHHLQRRTVIERLLRQWHCGVGPQALPGRLAVLPRVVCVEGARRLLSRTAQHRAPLLRALRDREQISRALDQGPGEEARDAPESGAPCSFVVQQCDLQAAFHRLVDLVPRRLLFALLLCRTDRPQGLGAKFGPPAHVAEDGFFRASRLLVRQGGRRFGVA
mmetsp:Transcript_26333/g.65988  ORF Transcript_26333/g.65988 Transcript_26333/m.65988 type:complete len:227 (+) Transcript_26333:2801-3481(+)